VEAAGCILRIDKEQWVKQVFTLAIYYSSIHRRWQTGQTVLFAHKTKVGDAFVGYGVIKNIYEKDELSDEEKRECEKQSWKKALEFSYVIEFKSPLPIKETFLKDSRLRGRYFHGLYLTKQQLDSILQQAENLQR
jgi:hypothetical protein